jgi:hypothetical protein
MGLMTLLLIVLANGFGYLDARTYWLWTLAIVGFHFLPFSLLHGPRVAVLGLLCMVSALAGILLPGVSFAVFGLVDGLLKVLFGIWLFATPGAAR